MNNIHLIMLYKYIDRKSSDMENDVIEVKNRMIVREARVEDYADLLIALARQEAVDQVLDDICLLLHKWWL